MSINIYYLIGALTVGAVLAGTEHAEIMKSHMCGDEPTEEGKIMIDCFSGLDWASMTEFNEATVKCCKGKSFSSGGEIKETLCDFTMEEIGECCDCTQTELDGKFEEQLNAFRECFPKV